MKRIAKLLLLAALAATAQAEDFPLWVGSTQVTSANADNILGDGTASFAGTASGGTLYLSDARITEALEHSVIDGTANIFSESGFDLTIQLSGSNRVEGAGSTSHDYCVYARSNLAITGEGTLVAENTGGVACGIGGYAGLRIDGATVTVIAGDRGLESLAGAVAISNATVTATSAGSEGIYNGGFGMRIDIADSVVTATGGAYGLYAHGRGSSLAVSGASVVTAVATGNNDYIYATAVYASALVLRDGLTISEPAGGAFDADEWCVIDPATGGRAKRVVIAPPPAVFPLWIAGVQFTSDNLVIDGTDNPEIASGTATFDPVSNTLSLTNFVYSGAGHSWTVEPGTENEHICAACIFYSGADALAVALSGTNSVALSAADPAPYSSFGFRSGNYRTAVSFAGAGSLSARAGAAANLSHGVSVFGPLAVAAGAEVAGAAGAAPSSGGVAAHGMIEVGGRLAGTGGASDTSEGIACYTMGTSEIVVSEGASVAAAGGAARLSYGILAKTLTVNGGEATAEGGEATTRSRALDPTSGDFVLAVADGWQVLAGEDADGAAPVEDDAWRTARYVRVAPAAYPVWVAGRQVTGANAANVLGDASASVSFAGTATNGTLTLRDAVIEEPFGYVPGQSNYGYIAIYTKSGSNFALTVALEGTNRVGSAEFASGFQTWSPLTITGGGVLFAVADDVAIFSYPSVLIDGATVFAEGRGSGGRGSRGWGIEASGFAATNATVQATGASVGITANGVWIGGDSTVVAEGGTAALGCYPPENFSLGDGLAVLEPAGGTPDLYVPILGRIFISSGGAAATRVVIGPPPPAVAATVTFNNGNGAVAYDGQGHGVEVEVTDPAEGAAVLFALGDSNGPTGTFGPTAPMFTNACDATVWVEISAEGYTTVTNSARVTIEPATLTITAKDQTYVYNGQPQGEADPVYADPADIAAKVDVAGLAPGDALAGIVLSGHQTDPGVYADWIVPSSANVTNATGVVTFNYAVGYANGTLTIREPPPPFVSNVVARQRWPWNGLVDVDYEISGYTAGLKAEIVFEEQGGTNRWTATKFFADVEPTLNPGRNRATWDSKAEGATDLVATVVATMRLVREE